MNRLQNQNERQSRQIRQLSQTLNQVIALAVDTSCLVLVHENDLKETWDNLNAEQSLTLTYKTIDAVEECPAPTARARTSGDALGQALGRMHAAQLSRAM